MEDENEITRTRSCVCRRITYELIGTPNASVLCHCIDWKKANGSNFMANDWYTQDQFHIKTGEELIKTFKSISETNDPVYRYFCSNCGSPVLIKNPKWGGAIIVPMGLLDIYDGGLAKDRKGPEAEYFMKRRCGRLDDIESSRGKRFESMV